MCVFLDNFVCFYIVVVFLDNSLLMYVKMQQPEDIIKQQKLQLYLLLHFFIINVLT